MLRTSSGVRAPEGEGWELLAGAGLAAAAAVRAATIPGARLARGTLRGRPALVVWTEAAWSLAGAGVGPSAAGAGDGVGRAPGSRVAPRDGASPPAGARSARRPDRLGSGDPDPGGG
jgi:hypothetical protein